MRQDPEPEAVVALVIMRPASGQALTGQSVITAATLPQPRLKFAQEFLHQPVIGLGGTLALRRPFRQFGSLCHVTSYVKKGAGANTETSADTPAPG